MEYFQAYKSMLRSSTWHLVHAQPIVIIIYLRFTARISKLLRGLNGCTKSSANTEN